MGCGFIFAICRKAESEGVTLALEPFTKYTTHICNEASQLLRLLRTVGSPALKGLGDTGCDCHHGSGYI
ncbi:MAG: TIM barrel protein [Enterocloster sp.]